MAPQEAKKPSVLVTGAAGGMQGATGRVLAERLLKRGVYVRALVRTDDERAASLRAAGAEVVVGDLLKIEDVARAAQGVDYMFFTFAVQGGLLEASTIAAIAARDAGKRHHAHHSLCLKGIINNSQWCADLLSPSPVSHRHALSEAVFDAFATPTVHLRGAIYHANLTMQFGRSAGASGVIRARRLSSCILTTGCSISLVSLGEGNFITCSHDKAIPIKSSSLQQ
ncbi:g6105 [Coccomyxa elongata]